ncbi:hypothetical protein HMPREF1146_0985 [Prevotella sp. MSX73]|nr:hypothetical protein HMPREF1146_0985 [Prevotella sp. MSX73]
MGFYGDFKPPSHSGWKILTDVFLLILFAIIQYLVASPSTDFYK